MQSTLVIYLAPKNQGPATKNLKSSESFTTSEIQLKSLISYQLKPTANFFSLSWFQIEQIDTFQEYSFTRI